jgi:DNA repair exonuclease SbcCD ATPase subunit
VNTLTNNLLSYVEKWENEETTKKNRVKELTNELDEWKKINPTEELKHREELKKKIREKDTLVNSKEQFEDSVFSATSNLQKLKPKLAEKEKEIVEINLNPENCPVCGNAIKDDLFKKYLQKRTDERDEFKNLMSVEKNNISNLKEKIANYEALIKNKTNEIVALNENIFIDLSDEEVGHLREKITSTESEISVLNSQTTHSIEEDEYIKNTQKKIEEIKQQSSKLKKKIKRLEEEQSYFDWWKDALGNSPSSMKSFCINHVLMSLNKYINYYLGFFSYDMSYNLDAELEDAIIKDGENTTFGQLSGGEKRSVEISLVFALYEIVRLKMPDNINIIVLDEILSNYLDEVRVAGTLDLLSELETRGLSIFVIDHRNLIKENLDCKVINVLKDKDGFSSLELS